MAAAADDWANFAQGWHTPYGNAAAVTPSDSADLTDVTRAVWVGGLGDLVVVMQGGATVTFTAVPAGTLLEIRVARIKNTDTTASDIVALW